MRSIETKIRLNALFIYLLVAFTCAGGFLYFYISLQEINIKRKTIEEYNYELSNINELIHAVNQAQAEVNLFIITERRKHLREFQKQAEEISLRIDTLRATQKDFGADTILTQITRLLKQKEQSIIRLNRQITHRNPIDSLSQRLSSLSSAPSAVQQKEQPDSAFVAEESLDEPPKATRKGFFRKLTGIFSSSKKNKEEEEGEQEEAVAEMPADTNVAMPKDTLPINQIITQARVNYNQHISAIENQFNSIVLADQYLTFRITELLTMLYNQVINFRMEEINEDEILLRRNNIRALTVGGIAMLLILLAIIFILHNANKGYAARKALEQAGERTRQLMEGRHKLLLSVSHDVKTPLNSMLGYVDLYRREGILTADEATPVYNSGNHILALLNNMLEFSGLEKGSVTLAPRNFYLKKLCGELCEMFVPLAGKKALTFDFRPDFPPDLILYSDSLKIKQILTNILSNAVKYTTEQGITFEASYTKGTAIFCITDTGAGIPAEKQEQLFKPFSRIKENSTLDEGSGFGLFVVKGLVELFKGEISCHSRPGKGTRITIALPAPEGEQQSRSQTPGKILIVDDDDLFLDVSSRLCRRLGHETATCRNRDGFMKELKNIHAYRCILTDMEMVNFSGEDVLRKTRELHKEIPVILVTGKADYSIGDILSAGFTDYLPKPVTIHALHALIGGKAEEVANDVTSFLDNDKEAIAEVMESFLLETVNHIVLLKEAAERQDMARIQYLCHKMLPMFIQAGAPDSITGFLKRADVSSHDGAEDANERIREELPLVITRIEQFMESIRQNYLFC